LGEKVIGIKKQHPDEKYEGSQKIITFSKSKQFPAHTSVI
jgi:hypothetical protein